MVKFYKKTIEIKNLFFKQTILHEFLFYIYLIKEYYILNNFLLKKNIKKLIFLLNILLIKYLNYFKYFNIFFKKEHFFLNIYIYYLFKWFNIYLNKTININKKKYKYIYQKILLIKKVSKTRAKGRIKKFKVIVIIGNKSGWFGIGTSKDFYLQESFIKARISAFKNIYYLPLLYSNVFNKNITLKKKRTSIILSSYYRNINKSNSYILRLILDFIGYNNIISKIIGKTNINRIISLLLNL